MSADFSKVMAHLANNLKAHAERDWPGDTGPDRIRRAVFLSRGGHAPGDVCPSSPPPEPQHFYLCEYPDDECSCHIYGVKP